MLKLKRFDEGVWHSYPRAEGIRFKIKPTSQKYLLDLRSKAKRKMAVKKPDGGHEIITDFDESVFIWERFKDALLDWEGKIEIEGIDNPPRDMIILGLFEDQHAREFIINMADEGLRQIEKEVEEELKNSNPSQSG